jgi:hypothetical protein
MDADFIILYLLTAYLFWSLLITPFLVASTRQRLFTIRDAVFLEFEHNNEYQEFRKRINLFIRFAEKASWQRIIFDFIVFRKDMKQNKKDSRIEFNDLELNKLFFMSTILIIRLIVLRSPVLMLCSMPLFIIGLIELEVLPRIKRTISAFVIRDANIYPL